MEQAVSSGDKRAEALLNEYKGNIYEFLVGHHLSRLAGIESDFMRSIRPDFYTMLGQQESFIREYYPELLADLPLLAQGLSGKIIDAIPSKILGIQIVGKAAAGLGAEAYGEGDLLATTEDGSELPISVKLSKAQAFVNTKSAGVKSFLSKYFSLLPSCQKLQGELTSFFDREFDQMAFSLHEKAGVDFDSGFENWKSAGLSQLPGELDPELREIFLGSLYKISNKLFESMSVLKDEDEKAFIHSLKPLIGYSRSDVIQATTFYRPSGSNYELDFHSVESADAVAKMAVENLANREATSSFDIVTNDRVLQIRLKAMNRFTGKGFKVNCAVKARS